MRAGLPEIREVELLIVVKKMTALGETEQETLETALGKAELQETEQGIAVMVVVREELVVELMTSQGN